MEYTLIRKKRKTFGIKISLEGEVLVYAPLKASKSSVESLLREKEEWIAKVRSRVLEGLNQGLDEVPFLGRKYSLEIFKGCSGDASVEFDGSRFRAFCGESEATGFREELKAALDLWYRQKLLDIVTVRIAELSALMGVFPGKVSVRFQKTIWGSCSWNNNISINAKLALAPPEIIDYILVHELCHIKHKNHSSAFWLAVESVLPDYKERKSWLKKNGYSLLLF